MKPAVRKPPRLLPLGTAFTGKLYRGEQDGTVIGWLWDHKTETRITFDGCRDPRGNGYLIMGKAT